MRTLIATLILISSAQAKELWQSYDITSTYNYTTGEIRLLGLPEEEDVLKVYWPSKYNVVEDWSESGLDVMRYSKNVKRDGSYNLAFAKFLGPFEENLSLGNLIEPMITDIWEDDRAPTFTLFGSWNALRIDVLGNEQPYLYSRIPEPSAYLLILVGILLIVAGSYK